MKLSLIDVDEFVELNHLQEVTSPVLFQRGNVPHPEGLVSNEIFGITTKDRKETFAYIDLHGHFLTPHAYKVVKSLFMGLDNIINGMETYSIVDGKLKKDPNGDTGIDFLYNNWNKLKWEDNDNKLGIRSERVELLNKTEKDVLFMTKQIVIPAFYRDIMSSSGGGGETSELNNLYARIIRHASVIKDRGMFDFSFHASNAAIQNNINEIYEYFKVKLEKKNGLFRKYLMGKNVDNAARSVITAPTYHYEQPDDMLVTYEYCAIPISQVCSLAYPFMVTWLKNFFNKEFIESKHAKAIWNIERDEVVSIVELDNPESYFNDKYIKNLIDSYIRNPESRFDPIELPVVGNKKRYIAFTGERFREDSTAELSNISNRPMTKTDLLYLAACDVVDGKHCLVTRYPLLDAFGVFINKIRVASTTETIVLNVNETKYNWYPKVEIGLKKEEIVTKFVDSLQFSNAYLKGLDGDYDGDQTTVKILWTQEANAELDKLMKSKSFFLNTNGETVRRVEIEPIQTFYTMTKEPTAKNRTITDIETHWLLSKQPKEFTFSVLVGMFGDLADDNDRKRRAIPKFNCMDKMTIPASKSPTGKAIETTVGRFIFNKILIEGTGLINEFKYINTVVDDGYYNKIESMISEALLNDRITTETMVTWIDLRDWLGFQMHGVITTSFSPAVIKTPKEVEQLKKELLKKYEKELAAGDIKASETIEKELIAKTKEVLKGDYGMDLYDSGARGSVKNNMKNVNLMRGAIMNPSTGKYDIVLTSLMDGMDKVDIPASSNSIVGGAYPKAVQTKVSGYLAKEILAALQTEVLDEPGSDCGTKRTLKIKISPKNKKDFLYRYIQKGEDLVLLTPQNIDSYTGKEVKMRSPMMCCGGDKICNKCIGEVFYKLGIQNAGLTASRVATTLTRLNINFFVFIYRNVYFKTSLTAGNS